MYCEVALGHPSHRGTVIPEEELKSWILKAQATDQSLFRSYYSFDKEILEHMKVMKTIRSYKGKFYLNRIIFDIDKGKDTDEFVLERARRFVLKLTTEWDLGGHISVWFSGQGYHILIPEIFGFIPDNNLPATVASTFNHYFPEADNIYDGARIIRVGNTLNEKSHLFKIPLDYTQFLTQYSWKEIHGFATKPGQSNGSLAWEKPKLTEKVIAFTPNPDKFSKVNPQLKDQANNFVTCMQKLYAEGPKEGNRHNSIMRMASAWRRSGIPEAAVIEGMKRWAPTLEPYEVERFVRNVFDKGYQFSCKDRIMEAHCDPKCIFFQKKNYTVEIANSEMMEKDYREYLKTDFSQSSINLIDYFPLKHDYNIFPGEFVEIIGDTGVNKTGFVQNLIVKASHLRCLFLSLEVHQNLLYRRFIQIAHNMGKEEVYEHYKTSADNLAEAISHVKVITISPELDAVGRTIAENNSQIVVVDTLDGINVNGIRDPEMKIYPIVLKMQEYAHRYNIIIIGIHHISKAASYERHLSVHSGKGTSAGEQKADKLIAIEGNRDEELRFIKSLKARDEEPFSFWANSKKKTFRFEAVEHDPGEKDRGWM